MPAKPTWQKNMGVDAQNNRNAGISAFRESLRREASLPIPQAQGARPSPRADPRASRSGLNYVDWTPDDQRRLDDARRANPAHSGRGVPAGAGRGTRQPLPGGIPKGFPGGKWPRPGIPGLWPSPIDLADKWFNRPPGWKPVPGNAPYMTLKCQASPLTDPLNGYNDVSHDGVRTGHVNQGDCGLQLQSWNGAGPLNQAAGTALSFAQDMTFVALSGKVNGPGGDPTGRPGNFADRFMYSQVWWWTAPVGTPFHYPVFAFGSAGGAPDGMPDPNVQRGEPGNGPANPGGAPAPAPAPTSGPNPDIGSWPTNGPAEWSMTFTPGARIPTPTPTRTVPGEPNKERKVMARSKALLVALFNALDTISEAAEVVDSFYEALPESVRKRWEKNHARPDAPFIDNAGQYGIDGADWKARALYYNWHKVDLDLAVRNVIKNGVEDRLLGDIHKRLPANTINALSPTKDMDPFIKISKEIDKWMDYLLDEAMKG